MADLNPNTELNLKPHRVSAVDSGDIDRDWPVSDADVLGFEVLDDLLFHQIAVWPESMSSVGASLAKLIGAKSAPGAKQIVFGQQLDKGSDHSKEMPASLLQVEPLKYWLIGAACPGFEPEQAMTLDLSHSRVHIRLTGSEASQLLNRHLALDLRESAFPIGTAASTEWHHVGVTLWRCDLGFELLLPRAFSSSLCDLLFESAAQFQPAGKDQSNEPEIITR